MSLFFLFFFSSWLLTSALLFSLPLLVIRDSCSNWSETNDADNICSGSNAQYLRRVERGPRPIDVFPWRERLCFFFFLSFPKIFYFRSCVLERVFVCVWSRQSQIRSQASKAVVAPRTGHRGKILAVESRACLCASSLVHVHVCLCLFLNLDHHRITTALMIARRLT